MTQPERQKIFLETIKVLKKSAAFAEAMQKEQVTRGTAVTLVQLTEQSYKNAQFLLSTLGGDTAPKII